MFRFADSIDQLHAFAREARGLDDFGADDYREALSVLCRSLDDDAQLTPAGIAAYRAMITDALEARLLVEAGWRRHPAAADAKIERPLFVIGLPRTGTTALHHLIAQDPGIQALEHWIQRSPKPRPPPEHWADDPDYRASVARVRAIYEQSPEMRAIHEIDAGLPDECWNTFAQNFLHSSYQANADVTHYAAWWIGQDMRPVYRRHLRTARLIGHREIEKRWLFKDATHLFGLDALLDVYPDALIVQTHRDPIELIPSVCSLCASARRALNRDTETKAFGRATLALWQHSIEAMLRDRRAHPSARFFDLSFARFRADPLAAIRDIYDYFDLPYRAETDAAIRRFREAHPPEKHGAHEYSLDDWGLDRDEIAERFSGYTSTFAAETANEWAP